MLALQVWELLIPISTILIIISNIPLYVHIKLKNIPGISLTIILILYGVLLLVNSCLNRNYSLEDALKEVPFFWMCAAYSFLTSTIQVAASGCCIRLLCHLIHIIDIIKLNQKQQQQQQLYLIKSSVITTDDPHTSIRTMTTNMTYFYRHFDHFFHNNNNNHHNNSIITLFLFWYKDHQQFIWDIILSWVSPIIYSILLFTFEYYEATTLYLEYSPDLGCLPKLYQSKISANIYYIYSFILLTIGCYFSGTFFRLIIFCGLYNIFNFIHLPTIILGYMTNVVNQKLPWSNETLTNSKNGLISNEKTSLEVIIFFGYPLLNFIWVIFFGTTKEALLLYYSIWFWIIDLYLNIKKNINHYLISSSTPFSFTFSQQVISITLPLTSSTSTLASSTSSNITDHHHYKNENSLSQHLSYSNHTSSMIFN